MSVAAENTQNRPTARTSSSLEGAGQQIRKAYLPVGPRIRAAVNKGTAAEISYQSSPAEAAIVSFRAPFDGLSAALAAI